MDDISEYTESVFSDDPDVRAAFHDESMPPILELDYTNTETRAPSISSGTAEFLYNPYSLYTKSSLDVLGGIS